MHDLLIVAIPTLTVLFGILLNRHDVVSLRADMKGDNASLRSEVKSEINQLRSEIIALRDQIHRDMISLHKRVAVIETKHGS